MPQAKSPTRRLPMALGFAQSTSFQLGDGEPRQQRGRRGQRVEGGEIFAVGDEPLEDAPGQVVGVFHACSADGLGSVLQSAAGCGRRQRNPDA